jgi:MFS family permease
VNRGFYALIAAQFFSALADSALQIAAIALLISLAEPSWMQPALKQCLALPYVLLAPVVGAFADSMAKGRVMLITNTIKFLGCAAILFHVHPLLAYAIVGIGAAAYSPAKYGILTELLPAHQLVVANGWMESTTVASIVLGTVLGGALISPRISSALLGIDVPYIDTGIDTAPQAAVAVILALYAIAAVINWFIPNTGVDHRVPSKNPLFLIREFGHCVSLLWRDRLGQISLATTTLFWGAGATLTYVVIDWTRHQFGYTLTQSTYLIGLFAVGTVLGAVLAARLVRLKDAAKVLPLGVLMGLLVMGVVLVHHVYLAVIAIVGIGGLAGFFLVPMNALLQHRGHTLMGAGHSIAVQNFNENVGIFIMVGLYGLMARVGLSVNVAIILFGLTVAACMLLVIWRYRHNSARGDLGHLIAIEHSGNHR